MYLRSQLFKPTIILQDYQFNYPMHLPLIENRNASNFFVRLIVFGFFVLGFASMAWSQSNPLDSTKIGFKRAKMGLYFKQTWNIGNLCGSIQYRICKKNTERLRIPRICRKDRRDFSLSPNQKLTYTPIFIDSFNAFEANIWQKGQPWGNFHPQNLNQYYGDASVLVKDGLLHLYNIHQPKPFELPEQSLSFFKEHHHNYLLVKRGEDSPMDTIRNVESFVKTPEIKLFGNIPMDVGLINTFHSFSTTYGYFAIRSKNPSGPATWPAFWLTGKQNWPPEIDIFEMYGGKKGKKIHTQTATLHFGKIETHTKEHLVRKFRLKHNTDQEFHIYACKWTPKRVVFYTDGIKIRSIRFNRWMKQYFQEPMYIVLNNQIQSRYLTQLQSLGYPTSDFQVDWIQVYSPRIIFAP